MIQIKPIDQTYTMEEIDTIVEEIYPGIEEFTAGRYITNVVMPGEDFAKRNFEFDRDKKRLIGIFNTLNRCNRIMAGNYTTPLTPEECDKVVFERADAYKQLKEIAYPATRLPTINNTDRERQVFVRAINAGYMERTDSNYKWIKKKAMLAYLMWRLYCPGGGEPMPWKTIEALFGVSRLDSSFNGIQDAQKPQKWREEMDELFKEV